LDEPAVQFLDKSAADPQLEDRLLLNRCHQLHHRRIPAQSLQGSKALLTVICGPLIVAIRRAVLLLGILWTWEKTFPAVFTTVHGNHLLILDDAVSIKESRYWTNWPKYCRGVFTPAFSNLAET